MNKISRYNERNNNHNNTNANNNANANHNRGVHRSSGSIMHSGNRPTIRSGFAGRMRGSLSMRGGGMRTMRGTMRVTRHDGSDVRIIRRRVLRHPNDRLRHKIRFSR